MVIYDPVNEAVVFGKEREESGRSFFYAPGLSNELKQSILKIVNTFEFNRLRDLKQAGLAYFVYPSALHDRYSHSIGTYYLGYIALRSVRVEISENQEVSLEKWLDRLDLKEEFLVALLLHDVGHLPFSHALEENRIFGKFKVPKHEEIACELILDKGDFCNFYKKCAESENKVLNTPKVHRLAEVLSGKPSKKIDVQTLCYLISSEEKYLGNSVKNLNDRKTPPKVNEEDLRMLHNLVSGLIDFDRIDHYLRDSYFMGIKSGVNTKVLIESLIFSRDYKIKISDIGVPQVVNLLLLRDSFQTKYFRDLKLLSLQAMLNAAVEEYFKSLDDAQIECKIREICHFNDAELINFLFDNGSKSIKNIILRIKNDLPYVPLQNDPISISNSMLKNKENLLKFLDDIIKKYRKYFSTNYFLLPVTSWKFGEDKKSNWLDLDNLKTEDGSPVSTKFGFNNLIDYLKKASDEKLLWLFIENSDQNNIIINMLNEIKDGTR